jgi:hypothetical protein
MSVGGARLHEEEEWKQQQEDQRKCLEGIQITRDRGLLNHESVRLGGYVDAGALCSLGQVPREVIEGRVQRLKMLCQMALMVLCPPRDPPQKKCRPRSMRRAPSGVPAMRLVADTNTVLSLKPTSWSRATKISSICTSITDTMQFLVRGVSIVAISRFC